MPKPKIYVTRPLPSKEAMEKLYKYCEVDLHEDEKHPPTREELLEHVRGKDALLCLLTDKIDREVLDAAGPQLRVVSTYSVGFDHIDVEECTKRGIYVCNTPGVLTEAVAELTWALILAICRRIVEADEEVRKGRWPAWYPTYLLGMELRGKTLGIVGLGRIGSVVARIARGFDMKVIYYDVRRKPDLELLLGVEYKPLDELLKEADIVSIHVPLTKETYHMIGERELKLMKPTAYLINTARGPVVDTKALVKALKEGWIRGAALDVFEQEPLPPDHELCKLKNVVLAPHIGSATYEARKAMADMAVDNLILVLKGKMPLSLVNPEVLKIRPLEKVKMIEE